MADQSSISFVMIPIRFVFFGSRTLLRHGLLSRFGVG
jgi:hypothetical protein